MRDPDLLLRIADRIQQLLQGDETPAAVVNLLTGSYGARCRFANGTHELKVAGVTITNTAGGYNLLSAWCGKARRIAAELAGQ
jgi:hypothetical protein